MFKSNEQCVKRENTGRNAVIDQEYMKFYLIVFIILVFANISGFLVETGSLSNFIYGEEENCDYDNWISHIAEGIAQADYNLYAPWEEQTDDFGGFQVPENIELQQWAAIFLAFIDEDLNTADALIDSFMFPYQVVDFLDTDTGRNYIILRENVDYSYFDDNGTPEVDDDESGAFAWGWGLYIYNPMALYPIILSAPHPNDDFLTVPVAVECFQQWDAMFMFVSGAGREVEWTEAGSYANRKSLSDPTRNDEHPLIYSCQIATNMIRETWRRELSVQLHSYDWNRHEGYANCQASTVNISPNLPLRDLSELHMDMINQADYLMVPENEYGNHDASYLNDYYAAYYSNYPFYYVGEDTTMIVNNEIDLTGWGGDFRTIAIDNWNSFDVYDPFFHMEMDELPNEFLQQTSQYHEFYGYDTEQGSWNISERYTNVLGWYCRWVEDLGSVIPAVIELDDGLAPTAVDSVWFTDIDVNSVEVNWLPEPAFDHYSYRVYIDTLEIDPDVSPYIDRDDLNILASPLHDNYSISDLELNQIYHLQIASLDYNDNLAFSDDYMIFTTSLIPEIELPESFSFIENDSLEVDFEPYISNACFDSLYLSVSGNINVNAVINGLQITFTSAENWFGSEILTFTVNDSDSMATATDDIEIIVTQGLTVSKFLSTGWNWLSLNITGDDMSLNTVMASLGNNASSIKNQTQSALYYEDLGWLGSLTEINNYTFYRLNVVNSATWEYTGLPVNPEEMIYDLTTGWNWISYAPQIPEDINYALSSLGEGGLNIKSQTQSSIYYTDMGWFGSLTHLQPLGGYMLNTNTGIEFSYPQPVARYDNFTLNQDEISRDFDLYSYEFNGTMVLASNELLLKNSSIIACVDGERRSICTLLDYSSIFGRCFYSLMLYSNDFNEDNFELYYQESENSQLQPIYYGFSFQADMTCGDYRFPILIDLPLEISDPLPVNQLLSVHPNPFNPQTNIHFELSEQSTTLIEVYNIKGQKLETLLNCELPVGKHSLVWTPQNQSSGIYFLKFKTSDTMTIRKMILLK
jgi:Secretion system C-terminal sorting domain